MRTVFLLLLCAAQCGQAQQLPVGKDGTIAFEEVVEAPQMPKGLLFENAKAWISSFYMSPRVVQSEDPMEGTISLKSMFRVSDDPDGGKPGGVVNYTMDIRIGEGKYKYTVTNFRHTDQTGNIGSGGKLERVEPLCGYKELKEEQWLYIKVQAQKETEQMIANFKKAMAYTSPDESDDF